MSQATNPQVGESSPVSHGSVHPSGGHEIWNVAAPDESDKVAILASKQNLDDLIWAMLRSLSQADWDKVRMERMYDLLAGMRQLSSEAFPPNDQAHLPPGRGGEAQKEQAK